MAVVLREYAGELVVERCWCGIQHAVPRSLVDTQIAEKDRGREMSIYCPLGHGWVRSGKTEAQKMKEEVERRDRLIAQERASHDQTRAALRETERRRRAEKAAKTKLKKRVVKGMCPCCDRFFSNVHRHISHMHPEYVVEAAVESAGGGGEAGGE